MHLHEGALHRGDGVARVEGLGPVTVSQLAELLRDVDLSKMHTVGDLQGGIEEAERQLGFRVSKVPDAH